ncbi:hypothetical protein GS504_03430, partial [Rhodococcus hoagii]|nr:hypothetical protein [Prescottella equi]
GGAGAEERTPPRQPPKPPQETRRKIGRPKGTGRNVETKSRTVTIQLDILEESLNAVDYLKTNPAAPRTFTQLLDLALFEMNKKLRDEYNGGEPFRSAPASSSPAPASTPATQDDGDPARNCSSSDGIPETRRQETSRPCPTLQPIAQPHAGRSCSPSPALQ